MANVDKMLILSFLLLGPRNRQRDANRDTFRRGSSACPKHSAGEATDSVAPPAIARRGDQPNFGGLVLGSIEAKVCKKVCV